jgi:hypothetical protein
MHGSLMRHKVDIWGIASSPWIIIAMLALGWGPLYVAEFIRRVRPDLDASYAPQAFGMGWMAITLLCSLVAGVLAVVHLIRFLMRLLGRSDHGG